MSLQENLGVTRWWSTTERETRRSLAIPVIGVFVSELLLFAGYEQLALLGHLITLLACVFTPALTGNMNIDVLQAFALVPLFRLVNLGMPVFVPRTLLWFPLIYAPLLPAVYVIARDSPKINLSFRPRFALLTLPITLIGGAILSYVEYVIITPNPLVTSLSFSQLALIAIVMFGFVGFIEELLFRGVLQPVLEDAIGARPGLILAGITFGLMHSAYGTPLELLFATSIGILFGYLYDRTRSLLFVTAAHGSLNVFLFAVLPLSLPL